MSALLNIGFYSIKFLNLLKNIACSDDDYKFKPSNGVEYKKR